MFIQNLISFKWHWKHASKLSFLTFVVTSFCLSDYVLQYRGWLCYRYVAAKSHECEWKYARMISMLKMSFDMSKDQDVVPQNWKTFSRRRGHSIPDLAARTLSSFRRAAESSLPENAAILSSWSAFANAFERENSAPLLPETFSSFAKWGSAHEWSITCETPCQQDKVNKKAGKISRSSFI